MTIPFHDPTDYVHVMLWIPKTKEVQSPLNVNRALHDTASFDACNCNPPNMVLSQDTEGIAQQWLEQPVEQKELHGDLVGQR